MKKILVLLLMAVGVGLNGFAQKGMNGVGLNVPVSVGQGTTALGIGVKYHYNISNYFRLEPSCEFFAIHSGGDDEVYDYPQLKAFLNANIFLLSPSKARPYIVAGLGYVSYKTNIEHNSVDTSKYAVSDDGFDWNIGLGYDFRLSHDLSMQIEATALKCYTSDMSDNWDHAGNWTFVGRLGLTYNF